MGSKPAEGQLRGLPEPLDVASALLGMSPQRCVPAGARVTSALHSQVQVQDRGAGCPRDGGRCLVLTFHSPHGTPGVPGASPATLA